MRAGSKVRLSPVLLATGAALLLAAVGVFHVWSHTRVLINGYELARLEAEGQRLTAERDRLRLEVATLRAPKRLEEFARARLGMAPPAPGTVVAGVAGRVAAAAAAAAGGHGGAAGFHPRAPAEPVSSKGENAALALRGSGAPPEAGE
jgi:cell division protein FtsL